MAEINVLTLAEDATTGRIVAAALLASSGGAPRAVVAEDPGFDHSALRISVLDGGDRYILWQGPTDYPFEAQLTRTHDGMLVVLPGEAVLEMLVAEGAAACMPVECGASVPLRISVVGRRLFGCYDTGIAELDLADGALSPRALTALPEAVEAEDITAMTLDRWGKVVICADDPQRGFAAWRADDAGTWTQVVSLGAQRNAFNAAVSDTVLRGGDVLLAVGPGPVVLRRLISLNVPGEVLVLNDDGLEVVCGETRVGLTSLMIPKAGLANAAAHDKGQFERLSLVGDTVYAASQQPEGGVRVYSIDDGWEMTLEGSYDNEVILADMIAQGGKGRDRVTLLVLPV